MKSRLVVVPLFLISIEWNSLFVWLFSMSHRVIFALHGTVYVWDNNVGRYTAEWGTPYPGGMKATGRGHPSMTGRREAFDQLCTVTVFMGHEVRMSHRTLVQSIGDITVDPHPQTFKT